MNKMTINGESLGASLQNSLAVEQFLTDNYLFRRNILNGKVEYLILTTKQTDNQPVWRTLTPEALNSIVRKAKQEQITKNSPKTDIQEVIYSDATPVYNPISEFLSQLPKWDGQNHLAQLFSRLPGISSEQVARIQQLNLDYTDEKDIAEIVEACFRKPNEGEKVKAMNCTQMLELISKEYPSLKKTVSTKVHLGLAMKDLGFEHTERGHVKFYNVVPVDAA